MWNNRNFITNLDKKISMVSIAFLFVDLFLHGVIQNIIRFHKILEYADILSVILLPVLLSLIFLMYYDGYKLNQGQIVYRKIFLKHRINYQEIGSVIISNAMVTTQPYTIGKWKIRNGKLVYMVYPWFTLIKTTEVKTEWTKELFSKNVHYLIDEDSIIYGFVWNDRNIKDFLQNYKGDYYIANSVWDRYAVQIEAVMKENCIEKKKIIIINDKIQK